MAKITVKMKLGKGLKKHDKINDLIAQCVAGIKQIHGFDSKRLHQSVTLTVMIAVREGCKLIDGEVDKNDIVCQILHEIYSLTDDELLVIKQQMVDIVENGDMKKVFFLKILLRLLKLSKRFIGL